MAADSCRYLRYSGRNAQQEEGAAFGAASSTCHARGNRANLISQRAFRQRSTRCCEPDPSTVTFYDEAYFRYRQSVEQIAQSTEISENKIEGKDSYLMTQLCSDS